MRTILSLGICLFLTPSIVHALTIDEKISELRQITSLVQSQYGPRDYKKSKLKVDPEKLLKRYSKRAKQTTNLEFYYLLNQFVAEFKDSHFRSYLNTDHVSKLGFTTDLVDGKVVIDKINRFTLSYADFPFKKGDQLMSVGRHELSSLIKELASYKGAGFSQTALRSAAMLVANRPSKVVPPQYGSVHLTIKDREKGDLHPVDLKWEHSGELLEEDHEPENSYTKNITDYYDLSVRDFYDTLPSTEGDFKCSGRTRIKIPDDATVLLRTPFVAYYHPTPKGNIGYLRIPHYSWPGGNDQRFDQYEWAVDQLEQNTVGLIIDQDHNCGGSVSLVEKMVGLFAKEPYLGLQFQFLATRNEYFEFSEWIEGKEDSISTIKDADLKKVLDLVKSAWLTGDFLAPKTTFHAERLLKPNRITYTKPIVMLIDEMSGSGGDAFPAMLQGIGRAKLFGTRTMGAGGHVVSVGPLYYSANSLRITKSLFYRPDGVPVENNGAVPDYPYTITIEDFVNQYQDYQKAYLKTLFRLIES